MLYFYFDFREEAKQTISGFLRSMLIQLACSGMDFPLELQNLYRQCESKGQQPTVSDLSGVFFSILKQCKQTFLIIDALDECSPKYSPDREGMLGLLDKLKQETTYQINVLILSRQELDIENALRLAICRKIRIQNESVDEDIRLHVRNLLADDLRLKRISPLMKAEIEISLVNGAHGM